MYRQGGAVLDGHGCVDRGREVRLKCTANAVTGKGSAVIMEQGESDERNIEKKERESDGAD